MADTFRVTVWNENRHEQEDEEVASLYPDGIHGAIATHLKTRPEVAEVQTATLDQPHHGLTSDLLDRTDVVVWWSHIAHDEVREDIVDRLQERILDGMGLIALHSSMASGIFTRLMGTTGRVKWREDGEKERLWVTNTAHPIANGLDERIEIDQTEMYGEPFDIPNPDELVFISWFPGGEVFRSGCCFYRGRGKIFYFRPGHETYPVFHNEDVLRILSNACRWAAPGDNAPTAHFGNTAPVETNCEA